MTFFKRAAAAALCAVMLAGTTLSAFAEGGASLAVDPSTETSVIDPGSSDSGETTVIDTGNTTETTIVDPDEGDNKKNNSGSGLDVADEQYTEIDISTYTQWDGKTKMVSGTNYYIDGKLAPRGNFTVPKESRLIIRNGAQLVIYKNRSFNVRGIITIEPEAELMNSGTLTIYEKGGVENYGSFKGSVSSTVKAAGDLINRSTGNIAVSGIVNIYKTGILLNYGETTFTTSSKVKVTGDFQTP